MAGEPGFSCSLVIDVPFPTARLATVALQALSVDKELSPLVRRSFVVRAADADDGSDIAGGGSGGGDGDKTVLRTTYEATTNRMLRVSVNAFLDSVGLVLEVMEGLDVDVLEAEGGVPLEPHGPADAVAP
ncbi:EKC/KEOPS complex, subunit Pcc1 [Niveomyces insectorum RCEF 264]|uniref:EKC/KEOPS complex, subunit Pcc1 n=1 Tax=Niveomyces insectorum RCEF 264 TaxID=1081102 RepID=A0A162MQF6_9HYPO|nr:EKC/KEOPS complex, subunit Pcc1 [Niveomyces insectorum RCEF 264]